MTSKVTDAAGQSKPECCMCGDCGFSEELFQCELCQFRSQHRYCSNLYPKAEAYGTCNWCLIQKDDVKEKSLNSSSSYKNNGKNDKINKGLCKRRPTEASPSVVVSRRKRIITNGALEERLRRTKSEDISNTSGITKQVFRNKVRRYKLLDEVSS